MTSIETNFNPLELPYIKRGVELNFWTIELGKIYYSQSGNRKQSITVRDPEELVRAEIYLDLVTKYRYNPKDIGIEVSIQVGSSNKYADIVIYHKGLEHLSKNIFLIVECKKSEISDVEFETAIKQANSYASSQGAKYSVTVSGKRMEVIKAINNFEIDRILQESVGDIPVEYGKPTEWRFFKGDEFKDIKPIDKFELMRIFKKCNNTLWDGGQLSPLEAFDEMSKIIFAKISDELDNHNLGANYNFQVKSNESADEVATRIHAIYAKGLDRDEEVFKDPIKISNQKLVTIVKQIEAINLNKTDLDSKGLAFEAFMQDFFVGKAGQYFTPREVIEFMVEFLEFGKFNKVLDPACGSSGFLLHALDKVRKQADKKFKITDSNHHSYWHDFAKDNLCGIELNRSLARVSKMNMIIHDDGHTNVIASDALVPFSVLESINPKFKPNSFDIVLSNPPFGSNVNSIEKEYDSTYELGKNGSKVRNNQKTEILFIERIHSFLKEGGKAGIILPDGILTNSSLQYVRDYILANFKLLAVVSLPQTAFSHYGAGVKSSVLFLQKWTTKELTDAQQLALTKDYAVFMAKAENIGYDATGRKTGKSDFQKIKEDYEKFEQDPTSFFV